MLPTGNIKKKYMCLHNYLKLPVSHKRGMEITRCSMMSHCLFYEYFYKHPACTASIQAYITFAMF